MASYLSSKNIQEVLSPSTRLRHLKLKSWSKIVEILSVGNRWLEVASNVKKPGSQTEFLYSAADISTLTDEVKRGKSPSEGFLQHWSTTGLKQPTIQDLLDLLITSRLFQAADVLSQELLQKPCHVPNVCDIKTEELLATFKSDGAEKDDGDLTIREDYSAAETLTVMEGPDSSGHAAAGDQLALPGGEPETADILLDVLASSVVNYRYKHLAEITGNFCNISVHNHGYKIGEGGFGVVYRAYAQRQWVAIKRLKESVDKQFLNELAILSQYKHENLLPLLGYSNDGPYCCLVYLYMSNGSLQERLACMGHRSPLAWKNRLDIALGTAKGIRHLHTFQSPPLVHRDIKSANILLDECMSAKVGDFGLARIGNSGTSMTAAFTSNVCGTSVYMAREAFHGEVSVKLDTFSFGVVLLEILTGLPPYDPSRGEDRDLITFMEANCGEIEDIVEMLDVRAGPWDENMAIALYRIAKHCIEPYKKDRPTVEQIVPEIDKIANS